jgi:hypothetical protein
MLKLPLLFADVDLVQLRERLVKMQEQVPNRNESLEVHRKFTQRLIETWLSAFDLTVEMINLSWQELEEIDQKYFYVYHLILQCKDSAVLVTEKTWQEVEERMYRVI